MGLPLSVEELDPEWVTQALQQRTPQLRPASVDVERVIWGTATKVLLRVPHAEGSGPDGPPAALCVKGAFDDEMRRFGAGGACLLEAAFYKHIADGLAKPMPHAWYADFDEGQPQGIVILEDLDAAGAQFGDPMEPWPVDRVAAALELLASWHGATWEMKPDGYSWLNVGSPSIRAVSEVLLGEEHWTEHFARPEAPRLPELLQDRVAIQRALKEMWEHDDTCAQALSHHDPHLGNTYIDAAGRPGFLDWQGVCLAPSIDDVTYFMGGALTIADRRSAERDLLAHYLRALAAHGGPALALDDVWPQYQRHHLHGFLWAVAPPVMQSAENVAAMSERHVAAIEDHDSLAVGAIRGA